ncbi:hypothetical protein, partial [Microbacterium sp. T32]|uniref:hypothetical protein n=1 Tax=Microbacterium sp. T32 TaxID=1776083 RepID=UPI000AE290B8
TYAGAGTSTDKTAAGVPGNATPVGWGTFLTPGGDLYRDTTKIASGVIYATAEYGPYVGTTFQTVAGVFFANDTTVTNRTSQGVPADAKPVGWDTYLTPTGDLYRGTTKAVTGVMAAYAQYSIDLSSVGYMYQTAAGVTSVTSQGTINRTSQGVPANAKPVGWDTYLTPTGELYRQATLIDTGVTAARSYYSTNVVVTYTTAAGAFIYSGSIQSRTAGGVPANATPTGWDLWLTPDGDLYYGTTKVDSNVAAATSQYAAGTYTLTT